MQPSQGRSSATSQRSTLKPINHQQLTVQQSFRRHTQGPVGAMQGAGPFGGPRFSPVPATAPAPAPAPAPQTQRPQWQFKSSPRLGLPQNYRKDSYAVQSSPQQAWVGQSQNNSTDFYGMQPTQQQVQVQ